MWAQDTTAHAVLLLRAASRRLAMQPRSETPGGTTGVTSSDSTAKTVASRSRAQLTRLSRIEAPSGSRWQGRWSVCNQQHDMGGCVQWSDVGGRGTGTTFNLPGNRGFNNYLGLLALGVLPNYKS